MSNYNNLKSSINNNIYENQTQQITGTVLNAILNEMTNALGAGYQFAGVATVGMTPSEPDARIFYLAGEGIYTSFDGIQVPAGKLGILKWDNRWHLETIDGLGSGGANLTGYVTVASTDDLPDEGVATLGYLCGTNLYLYVGEGGDTKEGKYQDCGSFRGPQGDSVQDVEQTQTSLENGGVNKIKFTLSNGISCEFQVRNGTTSSGLFPTLEALQAAYPSPVVGQYAFVGAGFPADIYVCTTAGTWTDSGEDYDGDNVDLTDYATKAEVNQLEAKVTDLDNEVNAIAKDVYTEGGYLGTDGVLRANASYKATPYIGYLGGNIFVKNSYNGASSLAIAFYDASKTFISGTAGPDLIPKDYNILAANVPIGTKYFRCSTYIGGETTSVYFVNAKNYDSEINGLQSQIDKNTSVFLGISDVVSKNLIKDNPFSNSGYINTAGEVVASSDYVNTGLFPKYKYEKLTYRVYMGGGQPLVTFYDADKNIITALSIIGLDETEHTVDLTLPQYDNVFYIALSNRTPKLASGYIAELSSQENLNDRMDSAEFTTKGVGISALFNNSGYYSTGGNLVETENARNTGLVPIPENATTIKYAAYLNSSGAEIVLFNVDKSVIYAKAGTSSGAAQKVDLSQYPTAKFFVVSVYGPANFAYASAYCYSEHDVLGVSIKCSENLDAETEKTTDMLENLTEDLYTQSGYIDTSGNEASNAQYKRTPFVPYEGGNIFILKSRNGPASCVIAFYNNSKSFIDKIVGVGDGGNEVDYIFDSSNIPAGTKYFRCSSYDGGQDVAVYAKGENTPGTTRTNFLPNGDEQLKILIFGDSITTCASFTINEDNETTAYQLNHPSNQYYDAGGNLVRYDMWPYLIKEYLNAFDVRNYAFSGASYKDATRAEGYERQNLSYQIEVAENDLTNPNNAFPTVGNFVPDIIIFALGTNDGAPNDTYDSAMAKTIMNGGGTAVDVSATLANLDRTKFNEAVRYAFLKLKNMFPYAITMCVLPIQRASSNTPNITTLHDALKKMAERHSMIVVDGAFDSGIITDNEVGSGLGLCLKDGLHPNEKGQNLMTRMILNAIKSNWINPVMMNP